MKDTRMSKLVKAQSVRIFRKFTNAIYKDLVMYVGEKGKRNLKFSFIGKMQNN